MCAQSRRTQIPDQLTHLDSRVLDGLVHKQISLAARMDASALLKISPEREFIKLALLDPPYNRRTKFIHYSDSESSKSWLDARMAHLVEIRERLLEDGSIWVHLDDNEVHGFKTAMDSLFGSRNFISTIIWQKTVSRDNRTIISSSHEYILVYAKNRREFAKSRNRMPSTEAQVARYKNLDNDPRGPWTSGDLTAKAGPGRRAEQFYEVTLPSGRKVSPSPGTAWRYTFERFEELVAENRIYFSKGDSMPRVKRFLSETNGAMVPNTWWDASEVGSMDNAKRELKREFPGKIPFETPKPIALAERILSIGSNPGEWIVDVYGGSGTTAVASQNLGRNWLTCERQQNTFEEFLLPRIQANSSPFSKKFVFHLSD